MKKCYNTNGMSKSYQTYSKHNYSITCWLQYEGIVKSLENIKGDNFQYVWKCKTQAYRIATETDVHF